MKKQLAVLLTFMMLLSTMCGFSVSALEGTTVPDNGVDTTVPDAVEGENTGTETNPDEGTDPVVEEFTITFKDFF